MNRNHSDKLFTCLLFLFACFVCEGRQRHVVVVGGGIAGLAAAREIRNCKQCDVHVTVFEARRDRYGGRVWTDRKHMPLARGIEAELGGSAINIQVKDNPLVNLTRDLQLEIAKVGESIFVMPDGKTYRGKDLADIYVEAVDVVAKAVHRVRSTQEDMSMRDAISRWMVKDDDTMLDSPVGLFLQSLPSFNIGSYSALLYKPSDIDFGYEQMMLDGMAELTDRLVSGSGAESPLDIELRKPVRQIEILQEKRRVLIRTKDREQYEVDAVVVAVPSSVLKKGDLIFEPPLSKDYTHALHQVGISSGNKLVLEFDEVFWPTDVGVFILAPSREVYQGFLQIWLNMNQLVGSSSLVGMMFGEAAQRFENMTDDQVENIARQRLSKLFGAKTVEARNITRMLRSDWSKDIFSGGASSFPQVGNKADIWKTLSEPICPGVYFAGEHTILEGIGSLHGAYNSGIRAAKQYLSGYCDKKIKQVKQKEKASVKDDEKEKLKKKTLKEKDKKDEL